MRMRMRMKKKTERLKIKIGIFSKVRFKKEKNLMILKTFSEINYKRNNNPWKNCQNG